MDREFHIARVLLAPLLLAGMAMIVIAAGASHADTYFNSAEPGCDGSDPSMLFCDDFEDRQWFATDCDNGGPSSTENDGWCATIFYGPDPQGTNFGRCGGQGAGGTDCAAGTGPRKGTSGMMADHGLRNETRTDEIYVRYYVKLLSGFQWGHEKMLTFNESVGAGGIRWGVLNSYFGGGVSAFITPYEDKWRFQNQGNELRISVGSWYMLELHIKLNTPGVPNGVYELWLDDCGPNGTSCPASSTLRSRHTDMTFRGSGDNGRIGALWFEAWANAPSVGESYLDQIVVSTRRIGPMGLSGESIEPSPTPPAPPFLLE